LLGLILWVSCDDDDDGDDELLHFTLVGDSKETGKKSESTAQYNGIL
jgi:hypothetical protein